VQEGTSIQNLCARPCSQADVMLRRLDQARARSYRQSVLKTLEAAQAKNSSNHSERDVRKLARPPKGEASISIRLEAALKLFYQTRCGWRLVLYAKVFRFCEAASLSVLALDLLLYEPWVLFTPLVAVQYILAVCYSGNLLLPLKEPVLLFAPEGFSLLRGNSNTKSPKAWYTVAVLERLSWFALVSVSFFEYPGSSLPQYYWGASLSGSSVGACKHFRVPSWAHCEEPGSGISAGAYAECRSRAPAWVNCQATISPFVAHHLRELDLIVGVVLAVTMVPALLWLLVVMPCASSFLCGLFCCCQSSMPTVDDIEKAIEEEMAAAVSESGQKTASRIKLVWDLTWWCVDSCTDLVGVYGLYSLGHHQFAVLCTFPLVLSFGCQWYVGGPRRLVREVIRSWSKGRYTNGFHVLLNAERRTEAPLGLVLAITTLLYTSANEWIFANNVASLLVSAYGLSSYIFERNDLGAAVVENDEVGRFVTSQDSEDDRLLQIEQLQHENEVFLKQAAEPAKRVRWADQQSCSSPPTPSG